MASSEVLRLSIEKAKQELEERGVAVVPDVLSEEFCDHNISLMRTWSDQFEDGFPANLGACIHKYNVCHHEAAWNTRIGVKPVFAGLWGTDKLHCSMDGISIGSPPEMGLFPFDEDQDHTLHHDQSPKRKGLHCYQGSVFLEAQDEDDWCFEVLEGSHKLHEEFFKSHSSNPHSEFRKLDFEKDEGDLQWYLDRDCTRCRVQVPKGGIVVWDGRTVHAAALPKKARKNTGRWRYLVYVCMTPAIWASPQDVTAKKQAYNEFRTTRHWPSNGVSLFRKYKGTQYDITELPEVAKSKEALLIAGMEDYDFGDGQPNGPELPSWEP